MSGRSPSAAPNPFEGMNIGGHLSRLSTPGEIPKGARIALTMGENSSLNGITSEEAVIVFVGGQTLVGADIEAWRVRYGR